MIEGKDPNIEDNDLAQDTATESARLPEEFLAGDTVAGLERLRTRLVDLTGKNRLLQFRHPGRSCLRIVGCSSDEIFGRLVKGQKLAFKPVPEPRREDYGPDRQKPTASEHAEKLNIPTSYELPEHAEGGGVQSGQYLQTLLYSSDLDTIARRLANSARTSIEESGTNMLYLVLGFLQWFDAEDSEQPRYAPLLVIPANMVREKSAQGGAIRNCLEFSGEDRTVNLCLIEKLRQDFSLELPHWDDEEGPAAYFARVRKILVHIPQWKLRTWGTVCLLYFGKLLMYLDLDPKRWPIDHPLHKHATIKELFEGLKSGSNSPAEDYDIDNPPLAEKLPDLIFDADSSQHSALIDALAGKNLVVEGPPGTGKSQTITNLIAASLVRGKTVLFVSEKLAALEVVRRRLDEAGLGVFCLELHSHKTQKQQILKELQERLKQRRQFAQPEDLDHKIRILQKNKETLIEYVTLINSNFGKMNQTLFDIIWARERLRRKADFKPVLVEDIVLDRPDLLSPAEFGLRQQDLEIYGKHASSILQSHSSIPAHPWYGVSDSDMTYAEEQKLLSLLQHVIDGGSALEGLLRAFEQIFPGFNGHSLTDIYTISALRNELPRPAGTEILPLLPHLRLVNAREVVRSFIRDMELFQRELQELWADYASDIELFRHEMDELKGDYDRDIELFRHELEELKTDFDALPDLSEQLRSRLANAIERASRLGLTDMNTATLGHVSSLLDRVIARVRRVTIHFREIIACFDYQGPQSTDAIQFILAAFDLLAKQTPFELMRLRLPTLEDEIATVCIEAAADEAARLRDVRTSLKMEYVFDRVPSAEELKKHAHVLETATLWQRVFGRDFRASLRIFNQVTHTKLKANRLLKSSKLRRLATFLEYDDKFRSQGTYKAVMGPHFKGIDTRWEELKRLLVWYQDAQRQFPSGHPAAVGMLRALLGTRTERLQEALRFMQRNSERVEDLNCLAPELSNLSSLLPTSLENSAREELSTLLERLIVLKQEIQAIMHAAAAGGIAKGTRLGLVPTLIEKLDRLRAKERDIKDKSAVHEVLRENLNRLGPKLSNHSGLSPTPLGVSANDDLFNIAKTLVPLRQEIQFIIDAAVAGGIATGTRMTPLPTLIDKLDRLNARKHELDGKKAAREVLNDYFDGIETEIPPLKATLRYADRIAGDALPGTLKDWLLDGDGANRVQRFVSWSEELEQAARQFAESWKGSESLAGFDRGRWFGDKDEQEVDLAIEEITARARKAIEQTGELSTWLDYLRSRGDVRPAKLEKLVNLVEEGRLAPNNLVGAFQYVVYNSLVARALELKPLLMQFSGLTHEKLRIDYARLDEEIIHLQRLRAAYIIDNRPFYQGVHTGPVSHWTEGALIVHEISKQARHIPIRQLVRRSAQALLALKPCFMLGPLSVAQYLGPGQIHFDLVVMDEASQLKPEDAMGAIARGGQIVIVGDPQQLPPSSFFERGLSDENLEDEDVTAAEEGGSILEVASSIYQPFRRLHWHYRSRHHSLIAFSNQEFYDGDLIVFPSAHVSANDLGVRFVPIQDGVYEARRNPIEAIRVVRAVLDHMAHHPKESLGVATLNFEQYELIDELLDKEFQNDPHARSYIEKWEQEAEPFFVKNLENVQGDERDVIFISMTYGRDAKGNFYQRFGPINGRMGHRRLNVLFTRAKKRTVVFSSMEPGMIREEPTSPRGLKVLKAYLSYAKTGVLEQPHGSSGAAESDFEVAVGQALRERGYEYAPQVGVAGFFIDLAVQHPHNPGSFILGIECDGASYHSGRSARDRDRLRQMILENLGWNIHRIWSTDWFKNRDREVEKLHNHIKDLLLKEEREAASRQALEAILSSDYGAKVSKEELATPVPVDAPRQLALFELRKKEVRRQLLDLRDQALKAEFPEVSPDRNLLRDEMMDLFLQKLPTTKTDWFNKVPMRLRQGTDLLQIRKYLPQILEILSQVTD